MKKGIALFFLSLFSTTLQAQDDLKVYNVGYGYFNVFLISVNGNFLMIDSGIAGKEQKIIKKIKKMKRLSIDPSQIKLILLTHVHGDHAGGAAYFQKKLEIPVLIHKNEAAIAEKGKIGELTIGTPKKKLAEWVKKRAHHTFPAFTPDLVLEEDTLPLALYGFPGKLIHAGGHTSGSIFYALNDIIFIGDLLRGRLLPFFRRKPAYHFFADDKDYVYAILSDLVEKKYQTYFVGHGGPLNKKDIQQFLKTCPL